MFEFDAISSKSKPTFVQLFVQFFFKLLFFTASEVPMDQPDH